MTNLHGLLLIDKPVDSTSHQVVARVRRILQTRDVGHAGTLDPIASGLLVLLIGQGTKISDYVLNGNKSYTAHIGLGVRTDTQDRTGQVLQTRPVEVTRAQVERAVEELQGHLFLTVPSYSAVKVAGRKLYEYARAQKEVELPQRQMTFHQVELLEFAENQVSVQMTCSKGSFVRAWVDHFGELLGCGAHMTELRRTHSYPYSVANSVTLEQLEESVRETGCVGGLEAFIPLASTLPLFPEVRVTGRESAMIANGQIANSLRGRLMRDLTHSSGRKILDEEGQKMLALVVSDEACNLRIRRVFRY